MAFDIIIAAVAGLILVTVFIAIAIMRKVLNTGLAVLQLAIILLLIYIILRSSGIPVPF